MSKYIVQPGKKEGQYFVIQLVNNKAIKKLGPYPKGTAKTVAKNYTAQDEARQQQLTAHHDLDKGEELSQAEAIKMLDDLKRQFESQFRPKNNNNNNNDS